jgi:hypothetical protein
MSEAKEAKKTKSIAFRLTDEEYLDLEGSDSQRYVPPTVRYSCRYEHCVAKTKGHRS